MFVFRVCLVLVGCSLVVQAATWTTCVCGGNPCGLGSGENICEKCSRKHLCEPIVVRPQEVPKPLLSLPTSLTPVPGPCACKKAIVKPAILPKPVCCTSGSSSGTISGCSSTSTSSNNQYFNAHATAALADMGCGQIVVNEGYAGAGLAAPADAVSIALAQQESHQYCGLDEDRLAFGFRKMPIEIPVQKIIRQNNIPEEKIFALNGQIVELKPVKMSCSTKSLDEEAVEDLLALQEEENAATVVDAATSSAIKHISLGELGYAPAKISEKTFIDIPASATSFLGSAAQTLGSAASSALSGGASGALGDVAGTLGNAAAGALGNAASSMIGNAAGALSNAAANAIGTSAAHAIGNAVGALENAAAGALGDAAAGLLESAASATANIAGLAADNVIGHVSDALTSGSTFGTCGDSSGFRAGKVEYKTVPKKVSITISPPEDTADCESHEAGEEQSVVYEGPSTSYHIPVTMGTCLPGYGTYHSSSSSSSSSSKKVKKARVTIQKLCNREY